MCGIVAIIGGSDRSRLKAMLEPIRQRGPDDQGVLLEPGVSLGHNRLSIIDLSQEGRQPICNEDSTVWLVFNGEIYNYPALREQVAGRHRFRSRTDSEVLLHLYEDQGPAMVHQLQGMFAFVIWDRRHDPARVFVARDPLGIKPLYYGRDAGGRLAFASEVKALLPATQDVREFPNGHYYLDGEVVPYWQVPQGSMLVRDAGAAADMIQARLEAAVEKRLVADVPLGVFLSGGLDSSLIAAIMHKLIEGRETAAGSRLNSFGVGLAGCADLHWAQVVADYLGTVHHSFAFKAQDLIDALPQVIYHLESFDPALVRSAIPTFFVARLARRHVTVVLSGEGADELFAGYHYLKEHAGNWRGLQQETREITMDLHNTNLQRVDRLTMANALEARVPFLDVEVVRAAFEIHPSLKQFGPDQTEKWILRKVAERYLPAEVVWRRKEKFATGTGVGDVLAAHAERTISDAQFARERRLPGGWQLQSKEELVYFRIWHEHFGHVPGLLEQMGRSRSIGEDRRYVAATR